MPELSQSVPASHPCIEYVLTGVQGGDGSRMPTDLELKLATYQGKSFYERVSRVNFS